MSDFSVRADSVNVEQIMREIRERIRAKRGVDYTEEQIRELAAVKLEKFLDPKVVRSDLLQHFQRSQAEQPIPTSFTFEDYTLFDSPRPLVRRIRRLLRPVLKLLFNPDPLIQALHIQARLNEIRPRADHLYYELFHNLVLETTRLSIEVKNLKMQIESLTGRLEFNERRARALESVVVYRPAPEETEPRIAQSTPRPVAAATGPGPMPSAPAQPGQASETPRTQEGPGQRSRRRRRRRGRRGGMPATALMGTGPQTSGERDAPGTDSQTASVDSNPTPPPAPEGQGPDTGQ